MISSAISTSSAASASSSSISSATAPSTATSSEGLFDRLDIVALGAGLDQRLEHLGRDLAFDGGLDELVDDLLGLGFDLVGFDGVDEFFGYELLVHRVLILGGG